MAEWVVWECSKCGGRDYDEININKRLCKSCNSIAERIPPEPEFKPYYTNWNRYEGSLWENKTFDPVYQHYEPYLSDRLDNQLEK